MANKIYKYPLDEMMPDTEVAGRFVTALCVDYQNGKPYLWAVVNDEMPVIACRVFRVGTGQPIDETVSLARYLNTTVAQSEPYVWHWFWR